MNLRLVLALAALLHCASAGAQVTTAIVADPAGSALATGTSVQRAGTVTTIAGGTLAGTNLFHSFTGFDLGAGDTARWVGSVGDPATIANVVSRVTGGAASRIEGTIDSSALPNAAFFFVNPAGIVFGAGAQVNVPGAAYFSTGSALAFADGARFLATTATGSAFSVAPPQVFAFTGSEGAIRIAGALALLANQAASFHLAASAIAIADSRIEGQAITLAATGTQAMTVGTADPTANGATATGAISLDRAMLIAHGRADPAIAVLAGTLTLDNGAALLATSADPGGIGDVVIATDTILLDHGATIANRNTGRPAISPPAGTYPTGEVLIGVRRLSLRNGATIATASTVGNAGDITITMPDDKGILLLAGAGATSAITTTSGPGTGGAITVLGPIAVISNGGALLAQGLSTSGRLLIDSEYFIQSADRRNFISVDGPIQLDANIYDVSSGTTVPAIDFVDASRVLSGQCAGVRASGAVSRLTVRPVGPYATAPATPATGGCR